MGEVCQREKPTAELKKKEKSISGGWKRKKAWGTGFSARMHRRTLI